MTLNQVMTELANLGNEQYKKIQLNHGGNEPLYGVKIGDLKNIVKKIKHNQQLALELYATNNGDAMYLAGLVADGSKMSKTELQTWAEQAHWHLISEYTVAWVAAESKFGYELATTWINNNTENIASSGWATLSTLIATKPNNELPLNELKNLLKLVENNIHSAKNRVRYVMNNFVIAVGAYIRELSPNALETANKIGIIQVNVGNTACKVPIAATYINNLIEKGSLDKKRKTIKC